MTSKPTPPTGLLRRLATDPLLGLVIVGTALWLAWRALQPAELPTIHVDPDTIRLIAAQRETVLGRPLTPEELDRIRLELIDEEVLLREARRLGLDRSDDRVRGRLLQLMRASLDETIAEPTEGELRAFFDSHIDRYWQGEQLTFEHLYYPFGSVAMPADPAAVASALEAGTQPFPEDPADGAFERATATAAEIRAIHGPGFTAKLLDLAPGHWTGPIDSAAGRHWFKLLDRDELPRPTFESMESYVHRDWKTDRIESIRREKLDRIEDGYRIVVAPGVPSAP